MAIAGATHRGRFPYDVGLHRNPDCSRARPTSPRTTDDDSASPRWPTAADDAAAYDDFGYGRGDRRASVLIGAFDNDGDGPGRHTPSCFRSDTPADDRAANRIGSLGRTRRRSWPPRRRGARSAAFSVHAPRALRAVASRTFESFLPPIAVLPSSSRLSPRALPLCLRLRLSRAFHSFMFDCSPGPTRPLARTFDC